VIKDGVEVGADTLGLCNGVAVGLDVVGGSGCGTAWLDVGAEHG
jgi:hypothetical protein